MCVRARVYINSVYMCLSVHVRIVILLKCSEYGSPDCTTRLMFARNHCTVLLGFRLQRVILTLFNKTSFFSS